MFEVGKEHPVGAHEQNSCDSLPPQSVGCGERAVVSGLGLSGEGFPEMPVPGEAPVTEGTIR